MKSLSLKIMLIFIIVTTIITNISYANEIVPTSSYKIAASQGQSTDGGTGKTGETTDDIIAGADRFIQSADTNNTISQDASQKAIDLLYNVFLAIGLVVAVAVGIVLGIQFMVASADGKAEVKEKLIPYTVGCVVIFGAFGIWKLVMILLEGF